MHSVGSNYSKEITSKWVVKWILENNHPFSIIDEIGFRYIMDKGGLTPPCRRQSVPKYAEEIKQSIQEKVLLI